MTDKINPPEDILRDPECISCFDRIVNHANGVFGTFEIQTNELFDDFHKKAAISLAETAKKTDLTVQEHFRKQELKEDAAMSKHFEKQALKYDNFEKKVFDLIWKVFIFFGAVALIACSIVGITWVTVQNKADKKDTVTRTEVMALTELGDDYNKSVYVKKDGHVSDTTAYYFFKKNVYGEYMISRGDKKKWYKDYEPYKSESKN